MTSSRGDMCLEGLKDVACMRVRAEDHVLSADMPFTVRFHDPFAFVETLERLDGRPGEVFEVGGFGLESETDEFGAEFMWMD